MIVCSSLLLLFLASSARAGVLAGGAAQLPLPAEDNDAPKQFDGYTVLRAVPSTTQDLDLLKNMAREDDAKVDFWLEPTQENRPVDMMVAPDDREMLEAKLKEARIPYSALIDDVQKAFQEENVSDGPELSQWFLPGAARAPPAAAFANFQRLHTIHGILDHLVASNPSIATTFSIGRSFEGRDLKAIKIGSNGNNKPAIWIDGGIHAREWISPATVLYIANQLVQSYGSDKNITSLVDIYDWYILPSSNPDGYEYTHTNNRMWRKTRSRKSSSTCYGADPNRNFGYHWNEGGTSSNPCSDIYAGSQAFSEPETKAIADFVLSRKNNIKIFLTVHAYSQLWLTPWGWTNKLPKDYNDMRTAAETAVNALKKKHGTSYKIGTSTNVLYIASGGSDDWAYGAAGIKYSYCLELRDQGRYGFALPANQIIPTGEETFEGVKTLAEFVTNELK